MEQKKMSNLEKILRDKEKILNASKEKRKFLINHEKTGLSFVFYEPTKSQTYDFREKVKSRGIEIGGKNYDEKQEKKVLEFEAELLAENLKTVFPIGEDEEETEKIDLNNEELKKAYGYSLPYEFFFKIMNEAEIDALFTKLVGFMNTLKD